MKNKKGLNTAFNKKGSSGITMLIIGIVIVVLLAVFYTVVYGAQTILNDAIQEDEDMGTEAQAVAQTNAEAMPDVFDSAIAFVLVISLLITVGLAYNAPSNPVMLVAVLLIIASLGFAGMIFSNMWDTLDSDADFGDYSNDFPLTAYIMEHYLIVVLVMVLSAGIAFIFGGSNL